MKIEEYLEGIKEESVKEPRGIFFFSAWVRRHKQLSGRFLSRKTEKPKNGVYHTE